MARPARLLTEDEIRLYDEQGYVVVDGLLSPGEVERLSDIVDGLVNEAADMTGGDDYYDLEPSHRPDSPRVRRLKKPIFQHEAFDRLARSPVILDVVEQLIGGGIRITHPNGKINIKAAEYGSPVEWHQDWAGYPHTNDDLLSVSIPLDDVEPENGPLLMIPGSHRGPVYSHHSNGVFCSAIDPRRDPLDYDKAVPLTGRAGMASFHHARTVHGSALNRSARSRRLLIYQYGATDAWPLTGEHSLDSFQKTILRGDLVVQPRMEALPVRLPLPLAPNYDGLYTSQENAENRYFEVHESGRTSGQASETT